MIEHEEQVLSHFGYWPEFSDAAIESFTFLSKNNIELCVFYIDANQNKSAHIAIEFDGTSDVALSNLSSTNVLDKITVSGNGPFTVSIESCYGLCGEFKCKSIKVGSFKSNPSFKRDYLR